MAEFCIAELGTVLGISTTSAKRLIGHALELRHRLPRLWSAVHAGRVPLWRARLVAAPPTWIIREKAVQARCVGSRPGSTMRQAAQRNEVGHGERTRAPGLDTARDRTDGR